MRILHICDSLNPLGVGGYESYLGYLGPALDAEGHESFIATQSPRRDLVGQAKYRGLETYYLGGNFLEARKWEFYQIPEADRDSVAKEMFRSDDLDENVSLLKQELREIIDVVSPDVIHAHSTYVVFNRVLRLLREEGALHGTPVVATIHGRAKPLILPDGTKTTDYDQLVHACPFDRVLAVSKNVAEQLRLFLAPINREETVHTLYLGVDTDVFRPISAIDKAWDIAFMGRLEHMKAVDLLPELVSGLAPSLPELRLLITGDGSLRDSILRDFAERGCDKMVQYEGVVKPERVITLINGSRIFIYPSREEPFGLSILEAMACGLPVISTNAYGPKEIITDGHDGFLVEVDDVIEMRRIVRLLLSNETLRMRIGGAARKTVEERFSFKTHVRNLLQVYKNLSAQVET
ncbi:MAG: glycosyltransferase family 4 protein [Candidatus Thorarchaeota archaeon]|nr:MAG: hypothetical protein DRP09_12795 [Candidatus Thorarchaeota archaeon]RLI59690.1 MAG: hypothetical protein DRO87_02165 [Candidatus Thorarchaeota archaeon]